VFILPPPEARNWAQGEGFMQPPGEYDSLQAGSFESGELGIGDPKDFDYINGLRWISGWMDVENFSFYRLIYGQGLNPTHWYQIGEDQYDLVKQGALELWDTSELDGLYTLQLVVVDHDGIARIATQYVTVDNLKPEIEVIDPPQDETVRLSQVSNISFEVSVYDNVELSRVELYLDGRRKKTLTEAPFTFDIPITTSGVIEFSAKAFDLAGNESMSDVIHISVLE
jgi:hypothetical protein